MISNRAEKLSNMLGELFLEYPVGSWEAKAIHDVLGLILVMRLRDEKVDTARKYIYNNDNHSL
jgi:hypothetical protein